ncbi:SsgA family sporulation/cell division regulator [Streptomyces sp. S.PB5]|uniref:SsgA family sporulation/cell division regulator n=1 Tax=Streptomyces sp. S.PB5 TaxID=3020844 RepID=UPI00339D784C
MTGGGTSADPTRKQSCRRGRHRQAVRPSPTAHRAGQVDSVSRIAASHGHGSTDCAPQRPGRDLPGLQGPVLDLTRALLDEWLRAWAGEGAVRTWPCGRSGTVLELNGPEGHLLVQFDTRALDHFLACAYAPGTSGGDTVGPAPTGNFRRC